VYQHVQRNVWRIHIVQLAHHLPLKIHVQPILYRLVVPHRLQHVHVLQIIMVVMVHAPHVRVTRPR
jgi:hypothetical protein